MEQFAGLAVAKMAEVKDDYGKWLIHGPQGSGKTFLASTIAKLGRTLFVDLNGEKGVRSFRGTPWEKNIDVVRPPSVTMLDDIFWELDKGGHGYKAVVLDSASAAQKMTMRFLLGHDETAVREIKQGTAPADQRVWGQALDVMSDLATFWYGLADASRPEPMHVVFTAQTKVTENELTGTMSRTPDVQRGAQGAMLAAPDYVLYTDIEEDLEAETDDGEPGSRNIALFGYHDGYRTKARIPYDLRGKLPRVIGRGKQTPDLATLTRVLRIGEAPAQGQASTKKAAGKAPAAKNEGK